MQNLLNSSADYEGAARQFADSGRAEVADFLDADFAEALRNELTGHEDWNLVFRDNGKHYDLAPVQWRAMTAEMQHQLRDRIMAIGRLGFQYNYFNIPMYDMVAAELPLPAQLQKMYDLLQSEPFLEAMRGVTGCGAIRFADCQATKFGEGHFLSTHDDNVAGKNRHAAYVLSLNPDWRPDFGGILNFPGPEGEPGSYILPRHNCLHLLAVPQPHFVSMVTPLAHSPRYGITGWLRS